MNNNNEAKKHQLLHVIEECDGAEVHREDWPLAEELRDQGLIILSSARGPSGDWKRAELKG